MFIEIFESGLSIVYLMRKWKNHKDYGLPEKLWIDFYNKIEVLSSVLKREILITQLISEKKRRNNTSGISVVFELDFENKSIEKIVEDIKDFLNKSFKILKSLKKLRDKIENLNPLTEEEEINKIKYKIECLQGR